jgi:multiple sugar transport system permease protein
MLEKRLDGIEAAWRPAAASPSRWSELLNNQKVVALLFLTPALAVLAFVVVYPFFSAIWISFHNKMVGAPAHFVGFGNYYELFGDPKFIQVIRNTLVYTFFAVGIKFARPGDGHGARPGPAL